MKKRQAFTLIELMIVMAIIGILTAIAIPDFLKFQSKAKQSEARVMMPAIASRELSHRLQTGLFVACPWNPAQPGGTWNPATAEWRQLGFAPVGPMLYQYSVEADAAGFVIRARGNIDNDADLDEWTVHSATLTPLNEKTDL